MARFNTSAKDATFSGRKPYVLFLCTGNTCRSPMAYGILRKVLTDEGITSVEVRTSGVMTIPGLLPTQECRSLLEKEGIDISNHRSSQMTSDVIKRAALVLGMTSFHVQMALRMSENARGKTFLLKEFTGSDPKNGQVQDPMGCTMEVYRKVYREIRLACRRLMKTDLMQDLIVRANASEKRRIRPRPVGEAFVPAPPDADTKGKKRKPTSRKPARVPAAKAPAKGKPRKKRAPKAPSVKTRPKKAVAANKNLAQRRKAAKTQRKR